MSGSHSLWGLLLSLALLGFAAGQISIAPLQVTPLTQVHLTDANAPRIYDGTQNPNPNVTNYWKLLRTNPIVGIHVGHVPGTDAYLFLGRNNFKVVPLAQDVVAGIFEKELNTWDNVTSDDNSFCSGLTATADGKICIVGGHSASDSGLPDGRQSVRIYDYQKDRTYSATVNKLEEKRWYPSPVLLPDGTIMIVGGTIQSSENGTASNYTERWTPSDPTTAPAKWPTEPKWRALAGADFYPSLFLLPTGDVFDLIDQYSRFIKGWKNAYRFVNGNPQIAPLYPGEYLTQFPHSGSAVMTALRPENGYNEAEVVMFGGTPNKTTQACPRQNYVSSRQTAANPYSFRLKMTFNCTTQLLNDRCNVICKDDAWVYSFPNSAWEKELMGIPRVGGDAVLLPNGDVMVVGGGMTGCVGGIKTSINRGDNPALWPLLYQPDRPGPPAGSTDFIGQRYTVLNASSIARMYHSTAVLTTDGNVMMQGCDACSNLISGAKWWSPSPDDSKEYRVEEYFTPYFLDTPNKPTITGINSNTDLRTVVEVNHGYTFTISWTGPASQVTSVSLVAPSMVTHNFNMNQRVVFLEITNQEAGKLTVKVPCNIATLPPQIYKVFIMNGKTYSRAWWIKLVRPGPTDTTTVV